MKHKKNSYKYKKNKIKSPLDGQEVTMWAIKLWNDL